MQGVRRAPNARLVASALDGGEEVNVEIVNVQGLILQEIGDRRIKRNSVALTYAFCIKQRDECDFGVINRAIIGRWSESGLRYIKERAWKIVRGEVER